LSSPQASIDHRVRLAAFEWLEKQTQIHGDVLPRELLAQGFFFEGKRVPFVGPQGIFKPKILPEIPLSIITTIEGPYDDSFDVNNLIVYRYRGTDPDHRDNVGLREAMERKIPLVYFHAVVRGKYLARWPVFVVGDDRKALAFKIDADSQVLMARREYAVSEEVVPPRAYATIMIRQRLHQQSFRQRVLQAYREQCACCRLKRVELLDAAHIIGDSEPEGIPAVRNGIALCKLHHAAFDSNLFGIRPDYHMEVRKDVLREKDGPMLIHGLQELNNRKIILPTPSKLSPDRKLLEQRFEEFRAAG
jgi:putative restriction endonuclease